MDDDGDAARERDLLDFEETVHEHSVDRSYLHCTNDICQLHREQYDRILTRLQAAKEVVEAARKLRLVADGRITQVWHPLVVGALNPDGSQTIEATLVPPGEAATRPGRHRRLAHAHRRRWRRRNP